MRPTLMTPSSNKQIPVATMGIREEAGVVWGVAKGTHMTSKVQTNRFQPVRREGLGFRGSLSCQTQQGTPNLLVVVAG